MLYAEHEVTAIIYNWMLCSKYKLALKLGLYFQWFQWQGQTWQFKVLPFGLSSVPYEAGSIYTEEGGIRSIFYLDNMLIMTKSREEAKGT